MNHKKIVENWIIVDTILKSNMGTIRDSGVTEMLDIKMDSIDIILKRKLGTIEDSGRHVKPRPYTKEKRNNNNDNKKTIDKCELKDNRCDFKDYSDLKDCADRLKVKCIVIDYSPLPSDYMEIK